MRSLRRSRAADDERHDAAAVQEEQPADRPAERQLALAVVEHRVPAHLLRERAGRAASPPSTSGSTSTAALPRCCFAVGQVRRPSASRRARAPPTSTPCFAAKPAAAGVGSPSGSNARRHRRAGHQLLEIGLALGEPARRARSGAAACCRSRPAPRRGSRTAFSCASSRSPSCVGQAGSQLAGISSQPISSSSSRSIGVDLPRPASAGVAARLDIRLGDRRRPAGARAGCRRCAR